MPLYDHRCEECGKVTEAYRKMAVRSTQCECGGVAWRIPSHRVYAISDVEFLTDNITGEPVRVHSRAQLRRLLTENGLSEQYGKGWQ